MRIAAIWILAILTACSPRVQTERLEQPSVAAPKPLPLPPPSTQTAPAPLIMIDAGHGGHDDGATCRALKYPEKRAALQLALLLQRQLVALGYRVALTRCQDVFLTTYERASLANQKRPQAFISLHFNHSSNAQASGIEVFFHNHQPITMRDQKSRYLAQYILQGALETTKARERGVKEAGFVVIRMTQMPSVLVEGGFLSHDVEGKAIADPRYLEQLAKGIAKGVHKYFTAEQSVVSTLSKSAKPTYSKAKAPSKPLAKKAST